MSEYNFNRFSYSAKNFARDGWYFYNRLRFSIEQRRSTSKMILIYSMGKVGSTSILRTLQNEGFRYSAQHVHFLTEEEIGRVSKMHQVAGFPIMPAHIHASKCILRILRKHPQKKIVTITAVRDPVAFAISNFFQNTYFFKSFRSELSYASRDEIVNYILNEVFSPNSHSLHYWDRWFDCELDRMHDGRIGSLIFDKSRGWQIYENGNLSSGVIRLEDMTANFSDFSGALLGRRYKLSKDISNDRRDKSEIYSSITDTLKIDLSVLDRIYSSKWVNYFYSHEEILKFKERWGATSVSA